MGGDGSAPMSMQFTSGRGTVGRAAWDRGGSEAPPIRTVAVTGATGFVGRTIVRALLSGGYSVRALVRDATKAARVLPRDGEQPGGARLDLIEGDVLDERSPAALLGEGRSRADAAIHLIGIIRETGGGQTFRRMHVGATRAMVDACLGAGVRRFVHMSALGVRPDAPAAYARTKAEAERLVRGAGLSGDLDWTIFRPGLILGEGGDFTRMMRRWAQGREAPWLFMPYFLRVRVDTSGDLPWPVIETPRVQPVRVEDVASAFIASLREPRSIGEIYNLAGPEEMPFPEMLRRVRDATDQARRDIGTAGIPGHIAAAQAVVLGWLGLGAVLPFDAGMALMGQSDTVAGIGKARQHLSFAPSPAL